MSNKTLKFTIELVSGKNIVQVKCTGYETEFFMPQIVNGFVTLKNIIPNRRCCREIKKQLTPKQQRQVFRWLPSIKLATNSPIAKSTPLNGAVFRKEQQQQQRGGGGGKENSQQQKPKEVKPRRALFTKKQPLNDAAQLNLMQQTNASSIRDLATPEQMRRINMEQQCFEYNFPLLHSKKTYENVNKLKNKQLQSSLQLTTNLSITPQQHQSESDYNSMQQNSLMPPPPLPSIVNNQSSFILPPTPDTSFNNENAKNAKNASNLDETVIAWRKVITPKRTYARNNTQTMKTSTATVTATTTNTIESQTNLNTMQCKKLISTKAPNPTHKVILKQRKIIIDRKNKLTSSELKKSIEQQQDLSSISTRLVKARNRLEYQALKSTAFDLLTSSNRRNISNKLEQQLRKCYINKASSTYSIYARLLN